MWGSTVRESSLSVTDGQIHSLTYRHSALYINNNTEVFRLVWVTTFCRGSISAFLLTDQSRCH